MAGEDLGALPFLKLREMREDAAGDQATQDALGPLEHRAFQRGLTQENPLLGTLTTLFTPHYTALKAAGQNMLPGIPGMIAGFGARRFLDAVGEPIGPMTSRASLSEMLNAYRGYGEGIGAKIKSLF